MDPRPIRVLHVEDAPIEQALVEQVLAGLPDLRVIVTTAPSEDAAVTTFARGFDLVILDYHLEQGDGLACLKRLRQLDTTVPIIALSGTATPEIAAELLEAGADDYFGKQDLDPTKFGTSVREALARSAARRAQDSVSARRLAQLAAPLAELVTAFTAAISSELMAQLDRFTEQARQANLSQMQLRRLIHEAGKSGADSSTSRRIRPLLLELLVRLTEDSE